MSKIGNWMKKHRKMVSLLLGLSLVVGLLCSGLTLAFLTQRDTVTNRASALDLQIQLRELNWLTQGEQMAEQLQPGMVIPKDPLVYNSSKHPVYVRMKIVLQDSDGNPITGTRYNAIVSALCYGDEDASFYQNGAYQNPAFQYYEGWFYWVGESENCQVLEAGCETDTLFTELHVPVLKSEYNGIFDSGFTIAVEAQGVYVKNTDSADIATVAAQMGAEAKETTE